MMTVGSLAGWALRSSVLILVGLVLLKALRVKDPAVRLAVWTAVLCASLAIPLLSVALPSIPVRTAPVAVPMPSPTGDGRSVRAKTSGPDRVRPDYRPTGGPGTSDPGRIHYPRATAQFLLMQTYSVKDYQIIGPDWLDREFFEIDA